MNNDELVKWAEKLIENHKNPFVKLPQERTKKFIATSDDEDELTSRLDSTKQSLLTERVELKASRTIADWLEDEKIALVKQQFGTKIQSMGFQTANGKFLHPFEALFLMETNRLELNLDNIPLTINQAYLHILPNEIEMQKYNGYRKIAVCYDIKGNNVSEEQTVQETKKFKATPNTSSAITDSSKFRKIFDDLKAQGPQAYTEYDDTKEHFNWSFPNADSEDQKLEFMTGEEFNANLLLKKGESKVFCITGCESTMLELQAVEIPDLPVHDLCFIDE